jgi:peptide-methionine (S)-S-oxide reductase
MCLIVSAEQQTTGSSRKQDRRRHTAPAHAHKKAQGGDVVTLQWHDMTGEDGFIAEPLFDREGVVRFELDGGNFLPGLHEVIHNLRVGDRVDDASIDAGYGARRKDLVFFLSQTRLAQLAGKTSIAGHPGKAVRVGDTFRLRGVVTATVMEVRTSAHDSSSNDPIIVLDANHPLAGSSYRCSFTVLNIEDRSRFDVATFAMGCFWGAELAFQRQRGVVATRCGYTQGITPNPTYDDVCSNTTQHREAVQVLYDPTEVSYAELVQLALARWYDIPLLDRMYRTDEDEDDKAQSTQYRQGIYYHCESQRVEAQRAIRHDAAASIIELLPAAKFWPAEEQHQQYLYKGGQSARKGAKEPIRCFG